MTNISAAMTLWHQGQVDAAAQQLAEIVGREPENAPAQQFLGVYRAMQKDFAAAEQHFMQASRCGLKDAQLFHNWGNMWLDAKQFDKAVPCLEEAIRHCSGKAQIPSVLLLAEAWINLNAPAIAHGFFLQIENDLHADPGYNDLDLDHWRKLASSFRRVDDYEAELRAFSAIKQYWPQQRYGYNGMANCLNALSRPEQAIATFLEGLERFPEDEVMLTNLACCYNAVGEHHKALACSEKAITIARLDPEVVYNHGTVLETLRRYDEAMSCYELAIHTRPGFPEPHFAHACVKLRLGDYRAGWPGYEWRWQQKDAERHERLSPLWRGEKKIAGYTMFVPVEQGFGDIVQFCRFLPLVTAQGIKVIFNPPEPLFELMQSLIPLAGENLYLLPWEESEVSSHHLHCPLLSLPLALGIDLNNIPAQPYLQAPSASRQRWREKLLSSQDQSGKGLGTKTLKVGLAWSGNPANRTDRFRSIPLAALEPLLAFSDRVQFFSLQKEVPPAQRTLFDRWVAEGRLFDCGPDLKTFADTAALISEVDLVISVETVVAHLAGALGQKLWIPLPFAACWRWLLERDNSPWYPSATLLRQAAPGVWGEVVAELCDRLQTLLKE